MAMLVDNAAMEKAKKDIDEYEKSLRTAGTTFISDLKTAISTFQGATKDVLEKDKIGTVAKEGTLANFVEKQIPDLIHGLGELLEGNRTTIANSDQQLANAISGNGGSSAG